MSTDQQIEQGIQAKGLTAPRVTPADIEAFQSTPVITDGRTGHASQDALRGCCFNPRPSSLTGERFSQQTQAERAQVSIHARHH